MNHKLFTGATVALFGTAVWAAPVPSDAPQLPPPMYQTAPASSQGRLIYVYDQKPLAGMPELIPSAQAESIVDQFRTNYSNQGNPRILIYVNRELFNQNTGLKLSGRSEKIETTSMANGRESISNAPRAGDSMTTHTVEENNYRERGREAATLADRQTVRDVERLMGRPLRGAGASLVDGHLATQLTHGRVLAAGTMETEQAQKDLKSLNAVTDVVIEVLMTSKSIIVPEVSGDHTYSVPDIQMTAIRLKDFKVIGQAAASDVMAKNGGAALAARNFGVQAITEATTLALMEDMLRETL